MKKCTSKFIRRISIFLLSAIFLFVIIITVIDHAIKPAINALAEVRVRYYAVAIMNNAIKEIIAEEDVKSIVKVIADSSGTIKLVQTDSLAMSRISTKVSEKAQSMLQELKNINISIPLGSLISNGILSGKGPNINITMLPAGAVNTDFSTEFENAGINQTRHKVYLELSSEIRIVAPLSGSAINVKTVVPITEMIIVGEVPDTYIQWGGKNDILNLVP